MIHPQIQKEHSETSFHCAFMTTLVSLESFVGVLFASFCGAVIVGKMTRAKSTASIRYSQRMVLRFGTGVMYTDDDDDRCSDADDKPVSDYEKSRTRFPCPVLEFRVANSLFGNDDGEITNAKISVVGSTLADKDKEKERKSATGAGSGKHSHRQSFAVLKDMRNSASLFIQKHSLSLHPSSTSGRSTSGRSVSSTSSENEKKSNEEKGAKKEKSVLLRVSSFSQAALENVIVKKKMMRPSVSGDDTAASEAPRKAAKEKTICVEEDPSGGLAPRKMFSSVRIESESHPFFKRVWTIRHVLNAESPLLSATASRMVKESRGLWPVEACNAEFIREHVKFHQMIVSMSGTTGASKVYGLNVYEYRNLHVGYTFAPILLTALDGKLDVDIDRIDNIREQRGGGAEPIDYYEANRRRHNFFSGQSSEFNLEMSLSNKSVPVLDNVDMPVPSEGLGTMSSKKMASVHDQLIVEGDSDDECTSVDYAHTGTTDELHGSQAKPANFPNVNTAKSAERRLSFG